MADATFQGISKSYGETKAVQNLDLHIDDGEFFVLLGPSGAGKTTTLRLMAGLETPDAGRIRIDGQDVTNAHPAARDVAFVFQNYSLYPHYTVFDNLAFPLRSPLRRIPESDVKKRVLEVAELLRIDKKLTNKATKLSGGEMQRVAIGRALVREPKLFLMDEPMSSLDAKLREDLRAELKRIQTKLGATIIYVTHDQVEATTLADRIGILENGVLRQASSPREVYDDPNSLYVAQRLGTPPINVLPLEWCETGTIPRGAQFLAARPEDVRVGTLGKVGTIEVVESLGAQHQLVVSSQHSEIRALVSVDSGLRRGQEVRLEIPAERRLFFNQQGERIRA
jgi:multiple sugar transport system ATP-binding protein